MKESAIVTVDWNQGSGFSLLNVQPYFEKRYQTKLEGCGFLYANHPNYEYPEHCYLQHTVVVYLRTQNSVRQIGDTLQSEHINFGDVAIIPAYINHWKKSESKISEIINNNIDKSIKVRDVTKLLVISQYYFCRLFRESTGITPYRYVIQQRVSKAKRLITENKMSLLDITFECGFSSQSQMTHHFHKLVGVTPKVYRDRFE